MSTVISLLHRLREALANAGSLLTAIKTADADDLPEIKPVAEDAADQCAEGMAEIDDYLKDSN